MKRKLLRVTVAVLALVMLSTALPLCMRAVVAKGTCGENVDWTLQNGVLTISGSGPMTEFTAWSPAPWKEYKDEIVSVVVEDGVTGISDYSFQTCLNLTEVTLPDSLTRIGQSAFTACGLENIVIPEGVTHIGYAAFSSCDRLKSITLSDQLTYLGDRAFNECEVLESIVVPDGVTVISDYTFAGASRLKTVTLPAGLKRITNHAFYHCPLTDVYFEGDTRQWENVVIGEHNDALTEANVHFKSDIPVAVILVGAAVLAVGVGTVILLRRRRA